MKKLITYEQAKKQICILQNFTKLIDEYDEKKSIESWIIKNYALTNSISKVIKTSNQKDFPFNKFDLNRDYIKKVILMNNKNDELQSILKLAYLKRYVRK